MHSRRTLMVASMVALLAAAIAGPVAQAGKTKDDYIVVLKQSVPSPALVAKAHKTKHGAEISRIFRHTIKGYSARLSSVDVAALRDDPRVAYIERDGIAHIAKRPSPGGSTGVASWGLDRIDERTLPMDGQFAVTKTGLGVKAYVIDTGVLISHNDFGGRASYGIDVVDGDSIASDCNGHGTHVAGTIGGATYGVAKKVNLIAVRVLNCAGSGTWAGVIDGLDWVVADARGQSVVANMSIGGGENQAVDDAVARATAAGVTVVVAAGNSSANACGSSPAGAPSAITVGATTSADARASYSNTGICVDIFAPGSGIKSAWRTKNSATQVLSGTSMASPHVAGVVALHLQGRPSVSPGTITSEVLNDGTTGVLANVGTGSPNRLLFTAGY